MACPGTCTSRNKGRGRTPATPARGRPGASRRTSRNEDVGGGGGGGAAGAGAARRAGPGHAQRGRRVQPPTSVAGKTSGGAAGVPGLPGRIPAAARRGADTANDAGPSRPLGPAVRDGHLNVAAETPVILAVAGRPSPQPDDHPRFAESDEQQNAEETEHQRRHTSTQSRVGLVNVDVAYDPLAIDDAGPVGVPSFQDPRLNPTGKSRLAKQIAHDLRMMGPNIGHLPLLYRRSRPRRNCTCAPPKQSITCIRDNYPPSGSMLRGRTPATPGGGADRHPDRDVRATRAWRNPRHRHRFHRSGTAMPRRPRRPVRHGQPAGPAAGGRRARAGRRAGRPGRRPRPPRPPARRGLSAGPAAGGRRARAGRRADSSIVGRPACSSSSSSRKAPRISSVSDGRPTAPRPRHGAGKTWTYGLFPAAGTGGTGTALNQVELAVHVVTRVR